MRVALDAMGGDHAPAPNFDGAVAALKADSELEIVMVGDPACLEAEMDRVAYTGDRLSTAEADGFVEMDEKPTEALRKKPNSSIARCWRMMASREVDAIISAGNTGAVVAAGLRTRLFLKSVKRPGIAVALPTVKGKSVLIDVGANPAARPEHLYQYGVMGVIYARDMFEIENPTVGLMNIGSEDGKGNDLYRQTHEFLSESPLKDRYVGNVEGRGLYEGEADVLICEGFVGNVVLKVSEGIADFVMKSVAKEILGKLVEERETARAVLKALAKRYAHHEAGGAPLLGIDGISIICHGSSDARSICNAVKVATNFKNRQINSQIVAELSDNAVTRNA